MVQKKKVRNTKANVVKLLRKMEQRDGELAQWYNERNEAIMMSKLLQESQTYWQVTQMLVHQDFFENLWDIYMKEED